MKYAILLAALLLPTSGSTAIVNITDNPYEFLGLQLYNVGSNLAAIDWSGSTMDFNAATPAGGGIYNVSGTFGWVINGQPAGSSGFSGTVDDNIRLFQIVGPFATGINTLYHGFFNAEYSASIFSSPPTPRLDGLGTSDMTGFYGLSQVSVPPSWALMICAVAALGLFGRKSLTTEV